MTVLIAAALLAGCGGPAARTEAPGTEAQGTAPISVRVGGSLSMEAATIR